MKTKIDRAAITSLRSEIDTALQAVRDNNPNLKITVGRGTYDNDTTGTLKIEFSRLGDGGVDLNERANFKLMASIHRVDEALFGKTIRFGGEAWKITGANLASKKYPFNAVKVATGKAFRIPATYLQHGTVVAE